MLRLSTVKHQNPEIQTKNSHSGKLSKYRFQLRLLTCDIYYRSSDKQNSGFMAQLTVHKTSGVGRLEFDLNPTGFVSFVAEMGISKNPIGLLTCYYRLWESEEHCDDWDTALAACQNPALRLDRIHKSKKHRTLLLFSQFMNFIRFKCYKNRVWVHFKCDGTSIGSLSDSEKIEGARKIGKVDNGNHCTTLIIDYRNYATRNYFSC